PDAKFSEVDRSLFAFASYNAGPGKIARMRGEAQKRGLDPDVWFNNVELVTAEKIGIETTTYVRNIYKYYVAYKLMLDAQEAKKRARAAVKQAGGARSPAGLPACHPPPLCSYCVADLSSRLGTIPRHSIPRSLRFCLYLAGKQLVMRCSLPHPRQRSWSGSLSEQSAVRTGWVARLSARSGLWASLARSPCRHQIQLWPQPTDWRATCSVRREDSLVPPR